MAAKTAAAKSNSVLEPKTDKSTEGSGCRVTKIKLAPWVEVGVRDGCICLWTAGREVAIGPLTPEQADKLAEDLAYEAVAEKEGE